jgi:hypothetical protein
MNILVTKPKCSGKIADIDKWRLCKHYKVFDNLQQRQYTGKRQHGLDIGKATEVCFSTFHCRLHLHVRAHLHYQHTKLRQNSFKGRKHTYPSCLDIVEDFSTFQVEKFRELLELQVPLGALAEVGVQLLNGRDHAEFGQNFDSQISSMSYIVHSLAVRCIHALDLDNHTISFSLKYRRTI